MKNNNELIPTGGTTENFESITIQPSKVKTTPIKKQTMSEKIIDKLISICLTLMLALIFILFSTVGSMLAQEITSIKNQTKLEQIYKAGYVRGFNKALQNDTTTFEYQFNKYIQKK